MIAVTGSSGKSTTSALIHHALDGFNGNRAHFAGNIGGSLLQNCPHIGPHEWLVLELSSFMLWWLGSDSGNPHWHARVGVLTNLCDNHLDWHGGAAHYSASKSIIRNQSADDQIFPGGTAFLCDAGMCGPVVSCLGREVEPIIQRFLTGRPIQYPVASGPVKLHGAIIEIDETSGRALKIERVAEMFHPQHG